MRERIELVYIIQNRVEKGIVYFLRQIIFTAILLLTFECPDNIEIFFYSLKYRISVFYMRAYGVGEYTPKQSRIRHCVFFLTDYI